MLWLECPLYVFPEPRGLGLVPPVCFLPSTVVRSYFGGYFCHCGAYSLQILEMCIIAHFAKLDKMRHGFKMDTQQYLSRIFFFAGFFFLWKIPISLNIFHSIFHRDYLEKDMATHSSILAWEIPWTKEPGGL